MQRFGFVCILLSFLIISGACLHWSFNVRPLFYKSAVVEYSYIDRPENPSSGFYWEKVPNGWHLYDKNCINLRSGMPLRIARKQCIKERLMHERSTRYVWKSSFTDFRERFFDAGSGNYDFSGRIFYVLILSGCFLITGFFDLIAKWIRSGKKNVSSHLDVNIIQCGFSMCVINIIMNWQVFFWRFGFKFSRYRSDTDLCCFDELEKCCFYKDASRIYSHIFDWGHPSCL